MRDNVQFEMYAAPLPTRRSRRRKVLALLAAPIVLVVVILAVLTQANGSGGAAAADFLRSTIGPERTAQVEGVYLGLADRWQQVQYRAGLHHVSAPWKVQPIARPQPIVAPPARLHRHAHAPRRVVVVHHRPVLANLHAIVSPTLPGEGIWTSSVSPASSRSLIPLIAKAFIRPDPDRPYAIATILRFDMRFLTLHLVAGTSEPGGAVGMPGAGSIPLADQQPGILLAAFNGGFKYSDGAYGMMSNHTVYVAPVINAATIAITAGGRILMGAWGRDPRLSSNNRNLMAWRQNGSLMINRGVVDPLAANDGAWGTTVLNDAHTWRSALGVTRDGALLYVAGNALSVSTLARALKEAGAQTAMEMDINPYWVRAFLYGEDPRRRLTMALLRPDMQGDPTGFNGPYSRDFLYVTRRWHR